MANETACAVALFIELLVAHVAIEEGDNLNSGAVIIGGKFLVGDAGGDAVVSVDAISAVTSTMPPEMVMSPSA